MHIQVSERRGVTLLELLAVITVVGVLAAVGMSRLGRSVLGDFGSQGQARLLSVALLHAQRAAIKTGDNHFVLFNAAAASSYQIMRRLNGVDTLVDGPHALSGDVTIAVSHTVMEFTFEGQALDAYSINLSGDHRVWLLTVIPINGAVLVQETTP